MKNVCLLLKYIGYMLDFRFFLHLSICFLISPALFAQSKTQRISVKGKDFVNEKGEVLVFRGLNASDPDKLAKEGKWNKSYFEAMKSWNANLVRFPVHPRAWRERGPEEYIKLLDDGIRWAKESGMYVIIDWHSIGNLKSEIFYLPMYDTSKKETMQFWRKMAMQYKDEPTVAFFELFNEPTTDNNKLGVCSWDDWTEILEEIILIIRANGAKTVPLIAGFNWAYDLKEVKFKPVNAEGVAYVSHPYPQKRPKPWAEKWENDFGFVATHYPVILTEIGFCYEGDKGAHIPVISDESYVEEIINYSMAKGISYCIWVFDVQWSPMLIKDWQFNPTEAGKHWKRKMNSGQ